ncbi:Uncharacterized conserved protein [Rhizobacter sp. OV335]|nr:Uncharacterized conserved protein [Rhizobacter sp. OV335]
MHGFRRGRGTVGTGVVCVVAAWLLAGCAAPALPSASSASAASPIAGLRLLGSATLARTPDGVLQHFGGISGMDRDPASGDWLMLSDDKSELAPARFYTLRLRIGAQGIGAIEPLAVTLLRQPDGTAYPGLAQARAQPGAVVPDPEALRIDPLDGSLLYTSEGDRGLGLDPFVRRMDRDGRFVRELALPARLHLQRDPPRGPRHNLSLEGLAFTPDAQALWVAMEAPLIEDGPLPDAQHGALARFSLLGRDDALLTQVAYPVDAIPRTPTGGGRRADNGVSEILAIDRDRLLVVERCGYEVDTMVFRFAIRLYEAEVGGAQDVSAIDSLQQPGVRPLRKRLLLDLSTLSAQIGPIDNIEAAAWGPRLPNGHATLLLASDDNFSPSQRNQFIALEVIPSDTAAPTSSTFSVYP